MALAHGSPRVDHEQERPSVATLRFAFAVGDQNVAGVADEVVRVTGYIGNNNAGLVHARQARFELYGAR